MADYVEKHLTEGENIVLRAKITLRAAIHYFILCGIVVAGGAYFLISNLLSQNRFVKKDSDIVFDIILMLIGIVCGLYYALRIKLTVLAVTDKKVIGKTGILRIKSMDAPLDKVNNVGVERNIWGIILKFGKIVVLTSSVKYDFPGVENYDEMRQAIMERIGTI